MTAVLVAGADRVDAGKTTFTRGLIARLDAIGFKPRAGNDVWFHHDDYRRAVDDGRLYGGDARKLAAASRREVTPEEINPVHRLWQPAPGGAGFLGPPEKEFVLDRVGDDFVVNAAATVPEAAREALPLEDATPVSTLEELNRVTEARYLPAFERLARRIERTERAVVESYGDVARPLQDFVPDRVAVIEPMRARVYDGTRYVNACEVVTGGPHQGQLEERVGDVTDLIEPEAAIPLPPLTGEERSDPERIATAYADAYDALSVSV